MVGGHHVGRLRRLGIGSIVDEPSAVDVSPRAAADLVHVDGRTGRTSRSTASHGRECADLLDGSGLNGQALDMALGKAGAVKHRI